MKRITLILIMGFLSTFLLTAQSENEFDFWVGKWNLTWDIGEGKIAKGVNHIEKTLDGKVIQENFEATDAGANTGFKGTSLSVYNPTAQTWHQAWADNQGGYFNFVGEIDGVRRIFKTLPQVRNGKTIISRMVFYDITPDTFTWDWERSDDDGSTWKLQWRISYERAD